MSRSTGHGLAFLMLLSFVASFLAARAFTILVPDVVIVSGGIHLHHFWYGLAMMTVAGVLAIIVDSPRHRRFYAVLFGVGGGLVGDEVGLLLTFGNYDSNLTFYFFVAVLAVAAMAFLFLRERDNIRYDVLSLGNGERTFYVGVVIAGLSALGFASGELAFGLVTLAVGLVIAAAGLRWRAGPATTTPT